MCLAYGLAHLISNWKTLKFKKGILFNLVNYQTPAKSEAALQTALSFSQKFINPVKIRLCTICLSAMIQGACLLDRGYTRFVGKTSTYSLTAEEKLKILAASGDW